MSIQEHLNKIRNAVYGYEVRESIAKGIETAYNDASEKDNANMEVKIARGTHPNLRSRLDETTTQLQQTATKSYVNGKVQAATLSYKESYDTLTDLQTAYPTGDIYNHVVLADGMIYTFTTEWVNTQIQANGTGIADYSITLPKTTFLEESKNLFNKDDETIILNYFVSSTGNITALNNYFISPKYYVNKNEKYTITKMSGLSTNGRAGVYDKDDNFLTYTIDVINELENTVELTIPNIDNIAYLRFNGWVPEMNTAMFVRGTVFPTEYVEYFYPRMSSEFTLNQKQKAEAQALAVNNISNKTVLFNGDSICYGGGWPLTEGGESIPTGYAKVIGEKNNLNYINYGKNGGTIGYKSDKHSIARSISEMSADADYIIFEGGINDVNNTDKGVITADYTNTFDDTTFCGGLESIFRQSTLKWPGKKIGFIIVHKSYNQVHQASQNEYWELAREICRKWSIPFLDLFNEGGLNVNLSEINNTFIYNADGVHPNERGYREYLAPKIEAWMNTL